MAEDEVRVWVKTAVLDSLVFGKAHTSSKRQSISATTAGDADPHLINWGWARGRVLPENDGAGNSAQHSFASASKDDSSSDGEDVKVQVYIEDDESEHNRTAIPVPALHVRDGSVVMANTFEGEGEDEGYGDDSNSCPYPDDLISLTHLHEPAVVYCLRQRYTYDKIYTATGPILLALNPFKNLKVLYSEKVMQKYYNRGERGMLMSGSSSAAASSSSSREERKEADGGADERDTGGVDDELLPPHVYGIADYSFRSMMTNLEERGVARGGGGGGSSSRRRRAPTSGGKDGGKGSDQAILVSGESGAGKTVTTKFIMQYLAMLSKRSASAAVMTKTPSGRAVTEQQGKVDIEQQVLQSNPILESFGNARTVRNDNSSRFGKYIEIHFSDCGALVGATIKTYLLEKVRIITQAEGERNYHIFYEILQGGMSEEGLEKYSLSEYTAEDFRITSCSGTYDRRDGVEDGETYQDLTDAMDTMGFTDTEQTDIMTVTCALLHSSNLTMNAISADESEIDKENVHLDVFLSLMGFTSDALNKALCYFSIKAGKESHVRSLPKQKAEKGLEAFVKAVYGALFDFIVQRINSSITVKSDSKKRGSQAGKQIAATIGVLDIFGFESFKSNSFEQLCINYCNEALQQQFNLFVLKNEQEEYEREGIKWSFISFPENQDVLDLIGKKGSGIIPILDDQCRAPGTTDKTFANDIYNKCKVNPRFEANFRQVGALCFGIKHYAGPVEYDTASFVEKNRDDLPKEATELLLSSTNKFVTTLADILSKSSVGAKPGKKITVGGQFSQQLSDLRSKIDLTSPHYVRCLKPNDMLVPDHFDPVIVADQLRCAGVVEAVRVSRVGYPQRYSHALFVNRYRILGLQALKNASRGSIRKKSVQVLVDVIAKKMASLEKEEGGSGNDGDDAADLLTSVGIQVGKTKVFLRRRAYDAIEKLRNNEIRLSAIRIQAAARRYIASKILKQVLMLAVQLQCLVRRMIATKEVNEIRRQHNACIIQTCYRRHSARNSFLKVVTIICWGQRYWRGRTGRVRYDELNRERKAIVIQKRVRMYQSSKKYAQERESTISIQCAVRCYWARRELKSLQAHAKNLSAVADERNVLRNETQSLRKELEKAKEIARIESEKAAVAAAASAEALKAIDAKQESEAEELRKENERLWNELEKAKSAVETSSSRLAEVQKEAKASLEEANAHASAADQAKEEAEFDASSNRASLEEALERARVADASKDDAVSEAKSEVETIKSKLDAQSSEISSLQEELESTKQRLEETQREAESSTETCRKLQAQADAASREEGNADITLITDELALVTDEKKELQKQLDAVQKRLDDTTAAMETKQEMLDRIEAENELLKSQDREEKVAGAVPTDTQEERPSANVGGSTRDLKLDDDNGPNASTREELKRLEQENAKLQENLQVAQQSAEEAKVVERDEAKRLKEENSTLQKDLLDAKAALSRLEKTKQLQKPMLSIPEDSEPDANIVEIHELHDEIKRLKEELRCVEEEKSTENSDSLLVRYQELSRLSSALVEKDKEIDDLKEQMQHLKSEFDDQVQLFKSSKPESELDEDENDADVLSNDPFETRSPPSDVEDDSSNGVPIIPSQDKVPPDPDNSFPPAPPQDVQMALTAYRDEVIALREINEILRQDVERSHKACEMAKWEAKEEKARSAQELEAFAQTLRGVDELRAAAESMSREITKNRKYYTTEDSMGAFDAASSVHKATKLLDASQPGISGGGGLWGRMTGGWTGDSPRSPDPQKSPSSQERQKGRRRRKRRGSGNKSVISAFF